MKSRIACHRENDIDYVLAEQQLGRTTLYNSRWRERQALWDGRRAEIVRDYGTTLVDLPAPWSGTMCACPPCPCRRSITPGDDRALFVAGRGGPRNPVQPEVGNIATYVDDSEMTVDDLPDPARRSPSTPARWRPSATWSPSWATPISSSVARPSTGPSPSSRRRHAGVSHAHGHEPGVRAARGGGLCHSVHRLHRGHAGRRLRRRDDDRRLLGKRGTAHGPARFRQFVAPGIERQAAAAHARGGIFIKHTDGHVWSILDDLVATGIDGWHGIQPNIGMDLRLLKERYGARLCFFGGLNCETLIEGTPATARAEVEYAIRHAACGGGLVIAPATCYSPAPSWRITWRRGRRRAISARTPFENLPGTDAKPTVGGVGRARLSGQQTDGVPSADR